MKIQLFGALQFKSQPWKNGGGSTLELYKYPNHEDYDFRLSIATVSASGPFSKFPGYLRTIIQLEGAPMNLRHLETSQSKTLERLSPYHFDGDALTDCAVSDTARDFNVIYKKNNSVETSVLLLKPNEDHTLSGNTAMTFLFCLSGNILVGNRETASTIVSENELCVLTQGEASKWVVITAGKSGASVVVVLKE